MGNCFGKRDADHEEDNEENQHQEEAAEEPTSRMDGSGSKIDDKQGSTYFGEAPGGESTIDAYKTRDDSSTNRSSIQSSLDSDASGFRSTISVLGSNRSNLNSTLSDSRLDSSMKSSALDSNLSSRMKSTAPASGYASSVDSPQHTKKSSVGSSMDQKSGSRFSSFSSTSGMGSKTSSSRY